MTLVFKQFVHNLTLRRRFLCIPLIQKNTHFFTFLETFAGHQQRLTKHHSSPHKNHHSVQNTPLVEPGAQKNIIAHKTPQKTTLQKPQVKQSVPLTSVNKPAAQNEVKTVDSKAVEGTRQATGRAILLHNANGQGHVVQGKTDYKKAILYIWRYNTQSSSIELWKLIHPQNLQSCAVSSLVGEFKKNLCNSRGIQTWKICDYVKCAHTQIHSN